MTESVDSHNITLQDVRGWSAGGRRGLWPDEVCSEVAARLNKMQWPKDSPREPGAPRPAWDPPPPPDDPRGDQLVQLRAQTAAGAKSFLDGLRACDSDRIKEAGDALERALPEIEFPFGYGQALIQLGRTIQGMTRQEAEKYLRTFDLPSDTIEMLVENTPEQLDRKLLQMAREQRRRWLKSPPRPKWHIPAFAITKTIGEVLARADLPVRGLSSRNSIVVRVVREAMKRMGHPNTEAAAIAQYFDRHTVGTPDSLRLRMSAKKK